MRLPGLDAYDRSDDASPQARWSRAQLTKPASYAPGTGPLELPLGQFGGCWCGKKENHDWPGKADRAPHPRD